jgi:hypothetical protein
MMIVWGGIVVLVTCQMELFSMTHDFGGHER